MSLMSHLVELSEKHRTLERQIVEEQGRPRSDAERLRRLKQEKLKLKDAMERIRQETRH